MHCPGRVGQGWSTASCVVKRAVASKYPHPGLAFSRITHCFIPRSLCARAERQGWACGLPAMAALPLPRLHITDASLAASRGGSLALPLEAGLQASGLGNSRGSPGPGVEAVCRAGALTAMHVRMRLCNRQHPPCAWRRLRSSAATRHRSHVLAANPSCQQADPPFIFTIAAGGGRRAGAEPGWL